MRLSRRIGSALSGSGTLALNASSGMPRMNSLGQSLDVIERLRPRHWAGFHKMVETGASRYGDGDLLSVPSMRKTGEAISVEFTIIPLTDRQLQVDGMFAVMRDVTARYKEMKRLREAAQPGSKV